MLSKLKFSPNVLCASLFCLASVIACSSDDGGAETTGGDQTNDAGDDDEQTGGEQTGEDTKDDGGESTSGEDDSGTESDDSEGDTETPTDDGSPKANGESCATNEECISEKCFLFDVGDMSGGICSDCLSSAECVEAGTGSVCDYDWDAMFFICNDPMLGDFCEEDAQCPDGLFCSPVFGDQFKTCGLCRTDDDCTEGDATLCLVLYEEDAEAGPHRTCVEPGTLPDGSPCDATGNGEEACENHCAAVPDAMDPSQGICGECRPDVAEDCADDQTCTPPVAGTMEEDSVPSKCE